MLANNIYYINQITHSLSPRTLKPAQEIKLGFRLPRFCFEESGRESEMLTGAPVILWFGSMEEKQAPCREPDVGLNPGSPGLGPGLKVVLNC